MKKIYIVTGSTGFVGNNVVKALDTGGETVVALAQSEQKVGRALKGTRAKIVYGNVLEENKFERLFEEARKISKTAEICFIHTASVVYLGNNKKRVRQMTEVNLGGAKNAIEACLKHNCRLLYVSSVHAIPEAPKRGLITEIQDFNFKKVVGKYAKTKAEASRIVMDAVKNRGLDAVMVHPSAVMGPNDYSNTYTTQMVQDYKDGRIPCSTNGGFDFVDVRDVAAGIVLACGKGKAGDCFLLTNKYISAKELFDTLYELGFGKKMRRSVPRWLARLSLPMLTLHCKITKKRPLFSRYSLYSLGSNSNFSHEKASVELGYKPRELKDSLKDSLKDM